MAQIQDAFQYSSQSNSSGSSSTDQLPNWYLNAGNKSTDYFNKQLNNLPTQGYQGDRYAGLSGLQQSGIGQGQGYIDQSQPMYGQGANMMGQGGNLMQGAYNRLSGAGQYDPAQMQQHMNPYLNGALNTMTNLANRNLTENVMPGVNSTFTGAGQFGSTRNADFMNRAIRDNQDSINNAAGTMLNQSYDQAANDYLNWDKSAIDAGQAMGSTGQNMGALGQMMGQYGITGLNTGMNLGQMSQADQQAALDAQKAQWTENYTFPNDVYGGLSNAYNTSVGRLTNQGSMSQSSSGSNTSYRTDSGITV
jgi:hypothetical protein